MTVAEYLNHLFEIEVNAHIAHLQTRSYAQHKALDELYTSIVGFRDSYAEAYQGIYGIITGYSSIKTQEGIEMIKYLQLKVISFRKYRESVKETELQQMIDDVIEFINGIIYKLKFLE